MIEIASNADAAFETLSQQLEQQTAALVEARRQSARMANPGDPARWRQADLLWPTFGKG